MVARIGHLSRSGVSRSSQSSAGWRINVTVFPGDVVRCVMQPGVREAAGQFAQDGGELATMDLVLLLLVAEAGSHAFGEYQSLGDGLLLIALIMGFNYGLNALSYRFRWLERLLSHPPVRIIENGRMLRRNMRKEFLTEEELETYLRKNDIDDISKVRYAYVEGEGQVTFVTRDQG